MASNEAIQIATMLAMVNCPERSKADLERAGYNVDIVSAFQINRALRADYARSMLATSDPIHGAIGKMVNAGIVKSGSDDVNEVKIAPRLILLGAEPILDKNTKEPTGRMRLLFRSTVTDRRKDGIERAQTAFLNTGEGQVLIAKAKSMKGHLVNVIMEMEKMSNGDPVRTVRDLTSLSFGPVRMADVERLGSTREEMESYGITPKD